MANRALIAPPAQVMDRIEAIIAASDTALAAAAPAVAGELLGLGEAVLERWLEAHGAMATRQLSEGFCLLALHRQGAKGKPSFNACRETCRELVYHHNLVCHEPGHPDTARRLRLAAMVARHLALFVDGKLEVAGLGEFCCSSRPLRERDTAPPSATLLE
jgi:hypothetical protein